MVVSCLYHVKILWYQRGANVVVLYLPYTLQDSGDLATDFSVAKSKKSVSKSFSDGFATEKNSVGKTLLAKLSDGNFQSVAKFSEGF